MCVVSSLITIGHADIIRMTKVQHFSSVVNQNFAPAVPLVEQVGKTDPLTNSRTLAYPKESLSHKHANAVRMEISPD